jgi:hypothetical protein
MNDRAELALVVKAIQSGLGGCLEWDVAVIDRLRDELRRNKLTLLQVRKLLIEFVKSGGSVVQVKEEREGWKDRRDYWYKVIVPMPALFAKGLFVELELINRDPEYPEVKMVQMHEQLS